jgi:hypothetical protein
MTIQAQQKVNNKEEPNFFMMRTARGGRKRKGSQAEEKLGYSAVLNSRTQ